MLRTILSNVSWRFLKGFSQFLCVILIVRNINISDYGWYISAISAFELIAVLSIPGIIKIALRSALADDKRFLNLLTLRFLMLPVLLLGFIVIPEKLAICFFLAVIADQISMFARVKLNQHRHYLVFNFLESLKPILLIICILLYLIFVNKELSLYFLSVVYCLLSIFSMLLNLFSAKRLTSFSIKLQKPSNEDLINSIYASGNGLISVAVRRGAIVIASLTFSYADAAYLNISLQFFTIFTMIYSGISLSLTRDIYDSSVNFIELKKNYTLPILALIAVIISSSIFLYFFSNVLLLLVFGQDSIGAASIIHLAPLILLFQLPQLILMGVFMRQKREQLILLLNGSLILFFTPLSLLFVKDINSLMITTLAFVSTVSVMYIFIFFKIKRT